MNIGAVIFCLFTLSAVALEREVLVTLVKEKQFDQAFALVEKELSQLPESNTVARAQLYSYQGELFLKTQRYEKAVDAFSHSLSIREKISTAPALMLESHLRMARAQILTTNREKAVSSYEHAVAIAVSLKDQNVACGLRAELAELQLKLGDVRAAWKSISLDKAFDLSDEVAIHWFSVRSKVSFASGSYAEAYQWLRKAHERWEKQRENDPQTGLVIAMESCALAQRLNRSDEAKMHLQDAEKMRQSLGEDQITASVRWSFAVLQAELSEADKAITYAQMVAHFDRCKSDQEFVSMGAMISAQVKLASLALDAEDYVAALHWCDQLEKSLPAVDSFRALLHRYRAAALFHQNQGEKAEQEAIASAVAAQRWLQRNRIFGMAENMIGLENSVDLLSPLMMYARMDQRADLLRKFLLENHDDGLSQWIQLRRSLHQSDQRDTMRRLFLNDQRGLSEQMVDQFQQWAKDYRSPKNLLDEVPKQCALVHYFIYRNEQEVNHYGAIVCAPDQKTRCIDLGPAELIHSRIRALLVTSEQQATDGAYKGTSPIVLCESLYQLLWAPLKLEHPDVVIRSAGMLQFVPWSILHDSNSPDDAGYLCQKYRSLRVVACSRQELRRQPSELRLSLLGVAEQQSVEEDEFLLENETFSDLPGVRREFSAIENTGIKPVYRNEKMTAAVFRNADVLSSTMLHLSCHGFVKSSDDPLQDGAAVLRQSGLVFHNYGNNESGLLYVGDAAYLPLDDVHSVVLSLCRGGLSNHAGLENWSSLRRAFLAAGVVHVAAAQWEIVDDDMQYFMQHLYTEIKQGKSLPEALQKTQGDWIEGKIPHSAKFSPAMRIATGGAWVVESAGW